MGDCQTISHTPHGPTYPVDEESEVRIQSIAWGQCSDLEPIWLVDEGNKVQIRSIAWGQCKDLEYAG